VKAELERRAWCVSALALAVSGVWGCAANPVPVTSPSVRSLELRGSDGQTHSLARILASHRLTVFVFYSEDCPCFSAHEPRLAEMYRRYEGRGVALFVVNSEVTATPERDAREARRRSLRAVLLTDSGGRLAKDLDAQFATHSVVMDSRGSVVYSGAIDSDRNRLRPGAAPYLTNALDALLAGRTPLPSGREALGCALQLR
jgi:peroxiredoxin